jgi:hypothetical protein
LRIQTSFVDLSHIPATADARLWRAESSRVFDLGRKIGAECVYLTGSAGVFMLARVVGVNR